MELVVEPKKLITMQTLFLSEHLRLENMQLQKLRVSAAGTISNNIVMDGGSAYGIGNTMHVVGITTSASHTPAVVEVSTIYDNVGDVIRISGVSSESYSHHHEGYNALYRITGISTGNDKQFNATSASAVLQIRVLQELARY